MNGQMFQTHDSELQKECTCSLPHSAFWANTITVIDRQFTITNTK